MLICSLIIASIVLSDAQFYIKNAKSAPRMGRSSGPPLVDDDQSVNRFTTRDLASVICQNYLLKQDARQYLSHLLWPLASVSSSTSDKSAEINQLA